ncbi:MAG: hypothetical protein TREMPRED_001526 [Tremellales sp. Tagirdzhanova-0007]|nr:MAG: hypothetical protein TREMPRED_001526 [Tremellales sp. Tagirdzhanova-0007]
MTSAQPTPTPQSIPEDLLRTICAILSSQSSTGTLATLQTLSKWCYTIVTPFLFRTLTLPANPSRGFMNLDPLKIPVPVPDTLGENFTRRVELAAEEGTYFETRHATLRKLANLQLVQVVLLESWLAEGECEGLCRASQVIRGALLPRLNAVGIEPSAVDCVDDIARADERSARNMNMNSQDHTQDHIQPFTRAMEYALVQLKISLHHLHLHDITTQCARPMTIQATHQVMHFAHNNPKEDVELTRLVRPSCRAYQLLCFIQATTAQTVGFQHIAGRVAPDAWLRDSELDLIDRVEEGMDLAEDIGMLKRDRINWGLPRRGLDQPRCESCDRELI